MNLKHRFYSDLSYVGRIADMVSGATIEQAIDPGLRRDLRELLALAKRQHDALVDAHRELNTIRARDGVPYCYDGRKSDVSEDWFSQVVDNCNALIKDYRLLTNGKAKA